MISILCSNYNSDGWIDNYLSYLNSQTLEEFEVIFVDASSTDDSLQKIKDFSFREGIKTKIIESKERIGIYAAWNLAIEESSFDYVMNYNTDDRLLPNALSSFYAASKLHPEIDILYSNCLVTDEPTHETIVSYYNWMDAGILSNLLQACCCGPFPLLKKKSIIEAGMFNPSFTISGDYEMWCRMCAQGYKFLKIPDYLGVYYSNPGGISSAPTPERYNEHIRQDTLIRQTYSEYLR